MVMGRQLMTGWSGKSEDAHIPGVVDDLAGFPGVAPLGHVLSRREFLRMLEVLGRFARGRRQLVLLLVDVSRFDWVNDAFGPETGDRVLGVLAEAIRRVAGATSVVGRLDGDQFGILAFVASQTAALSMAEELLAIVRAPLTLGGDTIRLKARVGISPFVVHDDPVAATLRYAGAALAEAKRRDCAEPVLSSSPDREAADRRAATYRSLPTALEGRELRVAYQDIVELRTGATEGQEALLRWRTRDGLDIGPEEIVPVAEEIGLIGPLGRWVLDEAVSTVAARTAAAGRQMSVAVNLSACQFGNPALVSDVARTLERHGLAPSQLAIEVTETLAVDEQRAKRIFKDIRALGCRVGLDDFGTGQSCLSYLRSLPIDFIKIDRSFVVELDRDRRAQRLVHTIVVLARDLGLVTVAEGVETEAQRLAAVEAGCRYGQGFLFGRPQLPG